MIEYSRCVQGVTFLGWDPGPPAAPGWPAPLVSAPALPFPWAPPSLPAAQPDSLLLDSGTTFTYLPSPLFTSFSSSVDTYARERGARKAAGPDPSVS